MSSFNNIIGGGGEMPQFVRIQLSAGGSWGSCYWNAWDWDASAFGPQDWRGFAVNQTVNVQGRIPLTSTVAVAYDTGAGAYMATFTFTDPVLAVTKLATNSNSNGSVYMNVPSIAITLGWSLYILSY